MPGHASVPYAPRSSRTAGSPIGSREVSTGTPPIQQAREVARERDRFILIGSVEGPSAPLVEIVGERHTRLTTPMRCMRYMTDDSSRSQSQASKSAGAIQRRRGRNPAGSRSPRSYQPTPSDSNQLPTIEPNRTRHRGAPAMSKVQCPEASLAPERSEKNMAGEGHPLGGEGPPPAPRPTSIGGGVGGWGQPAAAARCRPPLLLLSPDGGERWEANQAISARKCTDMRQR